MIRDLHGHFYAYFHGYPRETPRVRGHISAAKEINIERETEVPVEEKTVEGNSW